jgi:hypothetical protein
VSFAVRLYQMFLNPSCVLNYNKKKLKKMLRTKLKTEISTLACYLWDVEAVVADWF